MNLKSKNGTQVVSADAVTKYVGAAAYAVIIAVMLWIASAVQDMTTRVAVIESRIGALEKVVTELRSDFRDYKRDHSSTSEGR